jgi:aryl-alcohol dehydrogenase-like predicted oxidoreductase
VRYRQLGRTGIEVSEIGFRCGPTAALMVYGTPAEQQAAVARAYDELGITYSVVLKALESGALSGATRPHPTSALARQPGGEFDRNAQRARSLGLLARTGQTLVQAALRSR